MDLRDNFGTVFITDDGGVLGVVAAFRVLVRHPPVVSTLEDGRLVAVTTESVHHYGPGALPVVGVGDGLTVSVS